MLTIDGARVCRAAGRRAPRALRSCIVRPAAGPTPMRSSPPPAQAMRYSFRAWHMDVNAAAVPFREPREGRWLILSCSGPASSMDEDVFRTQVGPKLKALAQPRADGLSDGARGRGRRRYGRQRPGVTPRRLCHERTARDRSAAHRRRGLPCLTQNRWKADAHVARSGTGSPMFRSTPVLPLPALSAYDRRGGRRVGIGADRRVRIPARRADGVCVERVGRAALLRPLRRAATGSVMHPGRSRSITRRSTSRRGYVRPGMSGMGIASRASRSTTICPSTMTVEGRKR